MSTLTLSSPAIPDKSKIQVDYTCDGSDISPQLNWTGAPANTQTFALILSDPDAPGGVFYHWVLYNIPASTTSLAEGSEKLPVGAKEGRNSYNLMQYRGPCPPRGSDHHYIFTLYALDTTLALTSNADAIAVLAAMQNHILDSAQLTGTYNR